MQLTRQLNTKGALVKPCNLLAQGNRLRHVGACITHGGLRRSGVVDAENHLFVTHAVTNVGAETAHVANVARDAKSAIKADKLELVGDHA